MAANPACFFLQSGGSNSNPHRPGTSNTVSANPKPLPAAEPAVKIAGEQLNPHRWIIALSIMLGTILEILDTTIVNVSLPHMQGSFSASVDEITWIVTSYLVANGIMIPMTGWISSRIGRKRYFLMSVTGFVLASAACGAAQTLQQMIIFRVLQGMAGAAMQPSSQAILMETFPPEEQAMAMALWGIGMMVAPILGPTIGGWITDNWSWRWNFYINIPVGIIAIIMVSTFLHDPPYLRKAGAAARRVDYAGIFLIVSTLGLLQMVLDRGQRADWFASPWVTYATAGSAISLVLLVRRELTFPEPILDLSILSKPTFTLALMAMMPLTFMLFSVNLLNPIFLQEFMGYSALRAALVLAPRAVGAMAAMLLGTDRTLSLRRQPPGLDNGLLLPGPFVVQDGELEPANWLLGRTGADRNVWFRLLNYLPAVGRRHPLLRGARADGLRGQSLQHDPQCRRLDGNLVDDLDSRQSSANPSELPR
jgi:multidrug resistance protein